MNKCSPVDMRANLQAVEMLKQVGIDFVPMPAKNAEHKRQLLALADSILEEIASEAER